MKSYYFIQVLILVTSTQKVWVSAFAAFVPETETEDYDLDLSKPESRPIEDAQFYKMLSKVLIGYLNRMKQQDMFDEYLSNNGMPYYRGQGHGSSGNIGLSKRKVFWQPLGYNPVSDASAAAESHGSGGGRGPTFRYG